MQLFSSEYTTSRKIIVLQLQLLPLELICLPVLYQLFLVGLNSLNMDGTNIVNGEGIIQETYTQDDVSKIWLE